MLFSQGTSSSKGVCIWYELDYNTSEFICDENGRYVIARMEIQGKFRLLINCYAPNSEKKGKLRYLKKFRNTWQTWMSPLNTNSFVQEIGILFSIRQEILLAEKQY